MSQKTLAKLVLFKSGIEGKEFPIDTKIVTVGRWDPDSGAFPDIDLTNDDIDAKISRKHAQIFTKNGQFFLEDLGSLNGSYINRGERMIPGEPIPLKDGDEIILGKTFFKFAIIDND